ncbi:MAG: hypothetical protein HY720_01530 [Planctomycetes bacterium]|nr:hypothetical protein [Planctomycetota bacterium]
MPFDEHDCLALLDFLHKRPVERSAFRQLLLPEESVEGRLDAIDSRLDELTRQTDARFAELAQAQQRTEERMSALAKAQERTEDSLNRLTGRVGDLLGWRLEWRYRERTNAFFGRLLRKPRVLDVGTVIEEMEGAMSRDEVNDVCELDLLVAGALRDRPEAGEIWIALEISNAIDENDVERARRRAKLLARSGRRVVPAVAGERLLDSARSSLEAGGLAYFEDGRAHRWDEATARALGG